MSLQTWAETLVTAQVDGTALNTSTTPTSIIPAAARYTLPAGTMQIGKAFRIKFAGRLSNIVTTPGTLTIDVRMGPTSNIVVFNGAAMQLSTSAHTNVPIVGEVMLTCRAIGAATTANFMGQAWVASQALSLTAVADSTTTPAQLLAPNTAPAVGTGFDSTVAMVVDLFATFSISNAGNGITIHQYFLEALN
jgi:hypothetical protein